MNYDALRRMQHNLLPKWVIVGLATIALLHLVFCQIVVHAQLLPNTGGAASGGSARDRDMREEQTSNTESRAQPLDAGEAAPNYQVEPVEVRNVSDRPIIALSTQSTSVNKQPPPPNEFQKYVEFQLGRPLLRFGTQLLLPNSRDYAVANTATVPPDYLLNIGDVVMISMAGSIEGSVDKEIDTNGNIFLPKVGSVKLAGVRYGDLKEVIANAIGTQYRGFRVDVGVRALRGVRVYVTGFANNPGAYTVNSLSTLASALLAAGGPSSGGSYRNIELIRNNEVIRKFDLYQLVLNGNKVNDAVLENEDVINVGPVGPEIAVAGSVNNEAIFEIRPGETLEDIVRYAGGPNSLADVSRLILYRVTDQSKEGIQEVASDQAARMPAMGGDIVTVLSQGTLIRPTAYQTVIVRIEGEVRKPGNYVVAPGTSLGTVLEMAGGLTVSAFPFGTRLVRQSVKSQQRQSYLEAIDQLEFSLVTDPLSGQRVGDAGNQSVQIAAAREIVEKLRMSEPDGRVVLDIAPAAKILPADIMVEANDRIVVPSVPTTVGVFGAVYRPASFAISGDKAGTVKEYLERAGGALQSGNKSGIFVVRANGEVLTKRVGALSAKALPGDVIFVPVKSHGTSLWSKIKDITQMVFQLGLGAATVVAVTK